MPRLIPMADFARNKRKTFQDAPSSRQYVAAREWPACFVEVGRVLATSYSSTKWDKDGKANEYKHLAESPCCLHVVPGLLKGRAVCGPMRDVRDEMPGHITELAPLIAISAKLYAREGRDGEGILGRGDEGVVDIVIRDAVLFCGGIPGSAEEFLCVATPKDGIVALITGDKLRVTKDGIVGLQAGAYEFRCAPLPQCHDGTD